MLLCSDDTSLFSGSSCTTSSFSSLLAGKRLLKANAGMVQSYLCLYWHGLSLKQLGLHPMASLPTKINTVMLCNNSDVFPLPFLSFLYYNYLKALSRLHQLKLLGHTLVVEFAKEQDSVQVLSQPSVSEKCKR